MPAEKLSLKDIHLYFLRTAQLHLTETGRGPAGLREHAGCPASPTHDHECRYQPGCAGAAGDGARLFPGAGSGVGAVRYRG